MFSFPVNFGELLDYYYSNTDQSFYHDINHDLAHIFFRRNNNLWLRSIRKFGGVGRIFLLKKLRVSFRSSLDHDLT